MDIVHTVAQGEYLAGIARRYGFSDWKAIYDHPKNKDLKDKRPNPNILYPGDQVCIPKKEFKQSDIQAGQKFTVKMKSLVTRLQIVMKREDEKPFSSKKFRLKMGQRTVEGSTDGDGKIKMEIDTDVSDAELTLFLDEKDPEAVIRRKLKIGYLDPLDEITGMQARLNNLGYDAGTTPDANDPRFRSAVEEFQCDHKLKVDGICGPKTQAKLKEVHGC